MSSNPDTIPDGYRSLTLDEISSLEKSGCHAEDWGDISVAADFTPERITGVSFFGSVCLGIFDKRIETEEGFRRPTGIHNAVLRDVTVGDNCLIENIGCHINRYDIGEECYIANVGRMTTDEAATYGEMNIIPVMNEAGDGNVIIYDGLTSQMAAFMVAHASERDVWPALKSAVKRLTDGHRRQRGMIGSRVKIVNTQEIINTIIGDDCEVSCASRLNECTLTGNDEAGIYIGNDVICENTVIAAGASVLGGAKTDNCFIGEACHIGKGFSAENCVFFANSYMDNGEACAAFCGPFTVSHHKSTLLIGGMFSFYNAGSGTNYSNHAYKLGPIHHGTLERGAKTASGAHLLMPAHIGAFSMLMGKVQNHPDTRDLPFSYIIASGDTTFVVPGRNLVTVGTYRDTEKWPRRDMRPRTNRTAIVNFDWLGPYTIQAVIRGKHTLEKLKKEQGEDAATYVYGGCTIRNSALQKGIKYYDMAIRLYMGEAVRDHFCELPESSIGTGEWTDMAGLMVPESEVSLLANEISSGAVDDIRTIEDRFGTMHANYDTYKWNWTYSVILDYFGLDTLTEDDIISIGREYETARREWLGAIRHDAEREYALGDMDENLLGSFLAKLEQEQI